MNVYCTELEAIETLTRYLTPKKKCSVQFNVPIHYFREVYIFLKNISHGNCYNEHFSHRTKSYWFFLDLKQEVRHLPPERRDQPGGAGS